MNTRPIHYLSLISLFWLNACGSSGSTATNKAAILPDVCQVAVGQQIALTLDGQIPANTTIQWSATIGEVVWTGQGLTAVFLAPSIPGDAVIAVSFISGTPVPYTTERICRVLYIESPVSATIPEQPALGGHTIAISEIMGNPCGNLDSRKFNQYVELYNYGDQPVDVGGWWLFDEGEKGTPDHLVAWGTRSNALFDNSSITNATVIPAHGYAVVLSPIYTESDIIGQRMPYNFPAGTIILTAESSDTLGDDFFGIISDANGYDTLTLYVGGKAIIDDVVDTYGTPRIEGPYPVNIGDDNLDHIPLYLSDCTSAERVDPRLPDTEANWISVLGGSPGDGPYQ